MLVREIISGYNDISERLDNIRRSLWIRQKEARTKGIRTRGKWYQFLEW